MLVPLSPLPPHVDWDGLTSLSTALDALRDLMLSDVLLNVPIFVMGQPPLLFAASMYDEDMAMLILSQRHRIPVDVNVVDNHGFTALHYAADSDAVDLVRALLECPDVDVHATTEDLSVLGHVESGGRTPLHLASLRGNLAIVEALVLHDASMLSDVDWDGNSALRLAQLHGRTSIQEFLQSQECSHLVVPPPSVESCLDHEKRTQQTVAAARYASSLAVPAALANVHVLRSILTIDECNYVTQALIAHTNRVGWQTKRHTAYPTTDLPSYCLPQVHLWVLATLRSRLFPAIRAGYGGMTCDLSFRDLFYVKYERRPGDGNVQNALGLHCDGSILSFNVLLNPRSAFEGGGTFFADTAATVHIEQGDAAVHSGRVVHGAAPVVDGIRLILVGFLNARQRCMTK